MRPRTNRLKWAILLLVTLIAPSLRGATGTLAPSPYLTVFDSNGDPISGACVWTYTAGTTTPVATYTDVNLSVPNANPIIADSAGRFVAFLTLGQSYKFVFENACTPPAHGATIRTQDNIAAVPASSNNVDIVGTVGESVLGSSCVYLSDGSGGKTPGLWYKCDSGNAYSSTTPEVGIATANINSGSSGTIRLQGLVTSISTPNVGSEYFVSTGGNITSTAPTLRRHLGHADTATSLVLTADPPPPVYVLPVANNFRLSLTTGFCVTTSDVTAATTIFWSQCGGNRITLPDDTATNLETCSTAEKSFAVPNVANQMFDVFVRDSSFGSCTVTLETLAWTNDTTRATAVVNSTAGFFVKSGDPSRRYVGSFRTTAVAGQTEDSVLNRFVWNYYNRVPRALKRVETNDSWTYSTATIRQANGSSANEVHIVIGILESVVDLRLIVQVKNNSGGSVQVAAGIGESSTTTFTAAESALVNTANMTSTLVASLAKYPATVGHTSYTWLEWSQASATTTWVARDASSSALTGTFTGLTGWIHG